MKSKKLVIAITSFAFVFVAVIVSIVAIFAAQRQSVTTNFRVRFTATNVAATVSANVISGDIVTPMTTSNGDTEIEFLPQQTTSEPSLSPNGEIIIDDQTGVVFFEYIFENNSSTVAFSVDFWMDYEYSSFGTNLDVTYYYSYTPVLDFDNLKTTNCFEPLMCLGRESEIDKVYGDYWSVLYVYLKMSVRDMGSDAYLNGDMNWDLQSSDYAMLDYGGSKIGDVTLLNQEIVDCRRMIPVDTDIHSLPAPVVEGYENDVYTWFDDGTDELIEFPINLGLYEEYPVKFENAPYVANINVKGDDYSLTITNNHNIDIFIDPNDMSSFSYGYTTYDVGFDYLMIQPGQTVSINLTKADEHYTGEVGYLITANGIDDYIDVKVIYGEDALSLSFDSYNSFYAAYGEYPQTYVGDTLNNRLKAASASLTKTGKTYSADSVVVINGENLAFEEVLYRGNKYVCIKNVTLAGVHSEYYYTSNGDRLNNGECYYFHVEPIVVRGMEDPSSDEDTFIVMAASGLGSVTYSRYNIDPWLMSDMKNYLNGSFLNETGLSDVVLSHSNENPDYNGQTSTNYATTTDKIWLPTIYDVINWSGGDSQELIENGETFADGFCYYIRATDFAMATGTVAYGSNGAGACYYTRSPGPTGGVGYIDADRHGARYSMSLNIDSVGFAPVFMINISYVLR